MSDLIVASCVVDGLELQAPSSGYQVVSYRFGGDTLKRTVVESDDVDGRGLVAYRGEQAIGQVVVLCGTAAKTAAQVQTLVNSAITKFRGVSYTLTATFARPATPSNKWTESWLCEPADWDFAGELVDAAYLAAGLQAIQFIWPHSPIGA